MLLLDERFYLSPEKAQPGVTVHGLLLAMEFARADRFDDFLPCQCELLLRRFVAESSPLATPLQIQVIHSARSSLTLSYERSGLPAIHFRNGGMRAALGNTG